MFERGLLGNILLLFPVAKAADPYRLIFLLKAVSDRIPTELGSLSLATLGDLTFIMICELFGRSTLLIILYL